MRRNRRFSRREREAIMDLCKSAFILVASIVFLLCCVFGKQILMVIGGFVCVLALMYIMRRF